MKTLEMMKILKNDTEKDKEKEEIILRVYDENTNQEELDNLWISFHSDQEIEGKNEIDSSYMEQNVGELEPG